MSSQSLCGPDAEEGGDEQGGDEQAGVSPPVGVAGATRLARTPRWQGPVTAVHRSSRRPTTRPAPRMH